MIYNVNLHTIHGQPSHRLAVHELSIYTRLPPSGGWKREAVMSSRIRSLSFTLGAPVHPPEHLSPVLSFTCLEMVTLLLKCGLYFICFHHSK